MYLNPKVEWWYTIKGLVRKDWRWHSGLSMSRTPSGIRLWLINEIGSKVAPEELGFSSTILGSSYRFVKDPSYELKFMEQVVVYSIVGGLPLRMWREGSRDVTEITLHSVKI